ncbi:hypothetical protein GCM10009646_41450 [Streptomyces aureus]
MLYGEVTVAVDSADRFVTDEWGGAAAAAGAVAGPGIDVVVLPGATVVVLRGRSRNPAPSYA